MWLPGRVSYNPKENVDAMPEVHCKKCFHLKEQDCKEFGCECCCTRCSK